MLATFREDSFNAVEWVNAALASLGATGSAGSGGGARPTASDDTQISALIAKLQVLTQVRQASARVVVRTRGRERCGMARKQLRRLSFVLARRARRARRARCGWCRRAG